MFANATNQSTQLGQTWPGDCYIITTNSYVTGGTVPVQTTLHGYLGSSWNAQFDPPPRRRTDRSVDTPHFRAGAAGRCCPPAKLELAIHREYSTCGGYYTFTPKSITRAEVSSWRPRRLAARRAYKPVRSRPGMR